MLGHKTRDFKCHDAISLDELVPEDNFYRRVEQCIDLSFVRDLARDFYSDLGRPSIDPVVFFKLQLITFFEGIRSERQLMEMVNLNLAHRWYIGYDLDEPVPDHSSLSKIRDRYGLGVFQLFFEQIVEKCIEAGLVWGEELYFDSTKVQANADINSMVNKTELEAQSHLDQLFPSIQDNDQSFGRLIDKYDGKRILGARKPYYQRIADAQISPTDPDAAPMRPSGGGSAILGYRDHYVVDGGKARIILSALVTPASIMDNTPMLDLTNWVCSKWDLLPRLAVGDAKYGTFQNIAGLENAGIKAFVAIPDLGKRRKFYSSNEFEYDAEKDQYTCPQGKILPLVSRRKSEEVFVYRAKAEVCDACPMKAECTNSKSGRYIFRSFHQVYVERVQEYHQTEEYQKAMRKRGYWVEPLFGEAKDFHRLRRFRLRGLLKVNIEGVMVAAGQNLKRLIKHKSNELFNLFKELYEDFKSLYYTNFFNTLVSCKILTPVNKNTLAQSGVGGT
jgi:transposase